MRILINKIFNYDTETLIFLKNLSNQRKTTLQPYNPLMPSLSFITEKYIVIYFVIPDFTI
jgi:hypothetical protein